MGTSSPSHCSLARYSPPAAYTVPGSSSTSCGTTDLTANAGVFLHRIQSLNRNGLEFSKILKPVSKRFYWLRMCSRQDWHPPPPPLQETSQKSQDRKYRLSNRYPLEAGTRDRGLIGKKLYWKEVPDSGDTSAGQGWTGRYTVPAVVPPPPQAPPSPPQTHRDPCLNKRSREKRYVYRSSWRLPASWYPVKVPNIHVIILTAIAPNGQRRF